VKTADLTKDEQTSVRAALRFLRARCGGWANAGKVLHFGGNTLSDLANGRGAPSPLLAFRIARFAKVAVDDVLAGRFPPEGTCPHCGRGEL
jgi:hypothetical protein